MLADIMFSVVMLNVAAPKKELIVSSLVPRGKKRNENFFCIFTVVKNIGKVKATIHQMKRCLASNSKTFYRRNRIKLECLLLPVSSVLV